MTTQNSINNAAITSIATITGNTTLDNTYSTVLVDTTSGNVTVTLPLASGANGRKYNIKKIASANTLTIAISGSDTIDGQSSLTVTVQYVNAELQANAASTTWNII